MTSMVHLEDVADEVTVGHVGPMADQYLDEGIPFLRSLNVLPHRIEMSDLRYISNDFHKKLRKSSLRPGDVVIVRTGKPGTCAVIPDDLPIANCSDLVIVRCGPKLRPKYLSYWVNAVATEHVASHIVGAVQQHFNVGAAKRMPILLPEVEEQDRILSILTPLDDKIELNRKTAATLEEMARALYRSWFVDFDPVEAKAAGRAPAHMDAATAALFPDTFGSDGLPAGWKASPVGKLCDQVKQTVKPMEAPDRDFHHFSLPAYDTGALPAFEKGSEIKSNKLFVPDNAILFSRLNPAIPRVWWARTEEDLATPIASTEFYVARAKMSSATPWLYCLLSSAGFQENALARVTGTSNSHQRVPPTALTEIEVIEPSADIIEAFGAMAGPLFEKIHAMKAENQTLSALRDSLLPKLMSGELRMREARQQIEEVA